MSLSRTTVSRSTRVLLVAAVAATPVLLSTPAFAMANVTVANYSAGTLTVSGNAIWDRTITVDGVPMGTSDSGGAFAITQTGYTPPADCTIDVNDGSANPTTVSLNACTPTTATVAMLPDRADLGPFTVGVPVSSTVVSFPGSIGPDSWQIVAGSLPKGLTMTVPQPTARPLPNTPALPVAITPEPWSPVTVGSFSNLWIDGSGGLTPYSWSVASGALPPGMSLIQDAATGPNVRVGGTPAAAGTFTWTLKLTGTQGGTTTRDLSVTVADPAAPVADPTPTPAPQPAPVSMSVQSFTLNPATVTVPAGATSATFPIATTAVPFDQSATIDATYAGTLQSKLTVTAPVAANADTVSVSRAEYDIAKGQLWVDASSSGSGAVLKVYDTGTDTLIGSLSGTSGQFTVGLNPVNITVRSSLGGTASHAVAAK